MNIKNEMCKIKWIPVQEKIEETKLIQQCIRKKKVTKLMIYSKKCPQMQEFP